jgi:hypothetical protein
MQTMTKNEFIQYAHDALSPEGLEGLFEQIAEFNSEVAMFGDGGPGSLYRIRASIADVYRIERQLARLTGREPRKDFGFRVRMP